MLKLLFSILVLLSSLNAHSRVVKDINFEEQIKVGETTLKLNGVGVRKAMGMFEVYVAGLYVAQVSKDTDTIVNAKTPKKLILNFKRFVEKSKLQDAWTEGFGKNREEGYSYRSDLNKLNAMMSHMNEKEQIIITFYENKSEIQVKDKAPETIEGAQFSKTMLKVFINNPPDGGLKDGLLGN